MRFRHFKLLGLFSAIIFTQHAMAANKTIPADLLTGWNQISQSSIHQDINYLTADAREGRLALTDGDTQSIDWLVEQFKQAGLKPANGDSYLQTFNVISFVPDKKKSTITLMRDGKQQSWKKPDIITEFNHDLNLTAPVVFAGYGITAPAYNYDDYANVDVKGKIVLVFEHEPQERDARSIFNGTSNTIYASNRVKILNAQRHGAIGILIAAEPNRQHPSNYERFMRIGGSVKRNPPLPSMVLENDAVNIPVVVLNDKAAQAIAGKISLRKLQSDIDADLKTHSQNIPGATLVIQERVTSRKIAQTSNVVGLLQGSDKSLQAETILISAHHDHDGKNRKEIWHGADDNASGTTGVVELAKAMSANSNATNGLKPKRSILFAVFAAEERGLLGSYYMAANPLRPLESTRAVLNFDMIGRDEKQSLQTKGIITIPKQTNNRLNLTGAHYSPDYDKVVRQENDYVGLTLDDRFENENALNTFFRSDHFPFVLHNIPSFWWFTGFHPDYHHTSDTAEKIDYAKMQKILRLAYLTTYQLATMDGYPGFIANPSPGA